MTARAREFWLSFGRYQVVLLTDRRSYLQLERLGVEHATSRSQVQQVIVNVPAMSHHTHTFTANL